MTPEDATKLREPFPAEVIGKLPRVWCGACREATKANRRQSACQQHEVRSCRDCRNKLTDAHLHLDYIGHAETTDRFLSVDSEWTWEPLALDASGLPAFDRHGGLWIRLTIAGVTRLGYGAATEGKTGPDAVKEIIGDALRNAGMRFGVALDLWGAKFKEDSDAGDGADRQAPYDAEQTGEGPEGWNVAKPPSVEQVQVFADLSKRIGEATTPDEITALGGQVKHAQAEGYLTGGQYRALSNKAAQRIAELQQEVPS